MIDIFFEISAQDWAEIIRNYALATAAAITAYVALKGLSTWKTQKQWEDHRNVARKALNKSYAYMVSINDLRLPARSEIEKNIISKDRSKLNKIEEAIVESTNKELEKNLESLKKIEAEFNSAMVEASFLLNNFPNEELGAAQKKATSVKKAAMARGYVLKYSNAFIENYNELVEIVESSIISFAPNNDTFQAELIATFKKLHEGLKPHLGHNS